MAAENRLPLLLSKPLVVQQTPHSGHGFLHYRRLRWLSKDSGKTAGGGACPTAGLRRRRHIGCAEGSGVGGPLVGAEGSSIGRTEGGSGREPRGDVGDGTGPRCITAEASGGHASCRVNGAADASMEIRGKDGCQNKRGKGPDDAAAHSGGLKGNVYARTLTKKRSCAARSPTNRETLVRTPEDGDDFMDLPRRGPAGRRLLRCTTNSCLFYRSWGKQETTCPRRQHYSQADRSA
ncbi:unnamed protein product [Miscanthus lutarioriparius]|uniref:Uncharacterized protein n=1 Tax=Miscanthus lutarioriparius TaxID=422564 RepID=A0A811SFS9_9POAL|nr:unnamed protein product [Miscanthus lutarioriparius]